MLRPEDVLDQLHPVPADSDDPDADLEVEPADLCNDPSLELPETPMGSRSLIPFPCRGTRPHKQPDRYMPVRRLQVLPVNQCYGRIIYINRLPLLNFGVILALR